MIRYQSGIMSQIMNMKIRSTLEYHNIVKRAALAFPDKITKAKLYDVY